MSLDEASRLCGLNPSCSKPIGVGGEHVGESGLGGKGEWVGRWQEPTAASHRRVQKVRAIQQHDHVEHPQMFFVVFDPITKMSTKTNGLRQEASTTHLFL